MFCGFVESADGWLIPRIPGVIFVRQAGDPTNPDANCMHAQEKKNLTILVDLIMNEIIQPESGMRFMSSIKRRDVGTTNHSFRSKIIMLIRELIQGIPDWSCIYASLT
mmetsp:Transcript_24304/g.51291  ORF Transcript_24304/g.51291 Transcript_24304/m.51291 type:complete len:108 (-) Transcript_24304:119-442(-)